MLKFKLDIVLLFIFLLGGLNISARLTSNDLLFQPLSVEQGLPHNYVHSVTQDHKGFIWIGTNYGLARYDGYNFKVFQPDNQNKYSITHKPVSRLFADSKDRLWFAINSGGINKMDIDKERFTGYFFDSTDTTLLGFLFMVFMKILTPRYGWPVKKDFSGITCIRECLNKS